MTLCAVGGGYYQHPEKGTPTSGQTPYPFFSPVFAVDRENKVGAEFTTLKDGYRFYE